MWSSWTAKSCMTGEWSTKRVTEKKWGTTQLLQLEQDGWGALTQPSKIWLRSVDLAPNPGCTIVHSPSPFAHMMHSSCFHCWDYRYLLIITSLSLEYQTKFIERVWTWTINRKRQRHMIIRWGGQIKMHSCRLRSEHLQVSPWLH